MNVILCADWGFPYQDDSYLDSYISTIGVDFVSTYIFKFCTFIWVNESANLAQFYDET